ncbi:MAG TPA: preprotein translocase subunit SecG [Thermotogota bacterium]|nr:preprotein translocase subunit SecG [Thermotogota bacterium]HRW92371.1 preprotein translocase subunit SecG [Thermotogota bacterium]
MQVFKMIIYVLHALISLGLIVSVTLNMAKHSSLGGAFGSGASSTVFGREKGLSGLGKVTLWLSIAFMVMSFLTSYAMTKM